MNTVTQETGNAIYHLIKADCSDVSSIQDTLSITDHLGVTFNVQAYDYMHLTNKARAVLCLTYTYTRWAISYYIHLPTKKVVDGWIMFKEKPLDMQVQYIPFLDSYSILIQTATQKVTHLITFNKRAHDFVAMWNALSEFVLDAQAESIWFDRAQARFNDTPIEYIDIEGKNTHVKLTTGETVVLAGIAPKINLQNVLRLNRSPSEIGETFELYS